MALPEILQNPLNLVNHHVLHDYNWHFIGEIIISHPFLVVSRFPQLRLGLVDLPVPKPLGPGSRNRWNRSVESSNHPKSIQNSSKIHAKWFPNTKNIIKQLIFPSVFCDFVESHHRDSLLLHRRLAKDGGYILIHGLCAWLRHLKQSHGWSNHVPTRKYGILILPSGYLT